MAIDASIALGFRPPEQPSQINMLAQALQLQGLQRQNQMGALDMKDREAAAAERDALRNYLSGGANLDTPEGQQGLYKVAPTQAAPILKGRLELGKLQGEMGKTSADTERIKAQTIGEQFKNRQALITQNLQVLGSVNSPEQAAQWIQGGLKSGLIDMQGASQSLAEMQKAAAGGPQSFAKWKADQQQAGMTIAQQMDQQWKAQEASLRQSQFGETQRHNKSQEGATWANVNIARERLKAEKDSGGAGAKPPSGYTWGPAENGQPSLVPIKGGPADPSRAPSGAATEDERRSAGLAVRMEAALKKVGEVTATSPKAAKPEITSELVRGLPLVGEPLANAATSEARQRVDTAQIDALDAALTLATGAAYTKEQLRGLAKSYFPQIGDDNNTVADKNERLRTVIESARIRAGRAGGNIDAALNANKPAGFSDSEKERRYQEWKAKQK